MKLEELDTISRKKLLNNLLLFGWTPSLSKEYDVDIPSAIYISYRCGECKLQFEMKVLRPDLKGLNEYITCSSCFKTAYPSNISVKRALKRISWEDIFAQDYQS